LPPTDLTSTRSTQRPRLVAGTRGSELARTQTEEALAPLRAQRPDVEIDVRVIRTAGDRDQHTSLSQMGGQGVFARDIEHALLEGSIDVAVHSLKDLPPRLAPGLTLAAIPRRADPRDALVSRGGRSLAQLSPGSSVGTSSARRQALLHHLRPDLHVLDVRGNVGTRIRRVRDGELDGVILAAAGLGRLGWLQEAAEIFGTEVMLPAPGQGALALEARASDRKTLELLSPLDHLESHRCALAERAFLERLGAGCSAPVGAYATTAGDAGDRIRLDAFIALTDGEKLWRAAEEGPSSAAVTTGVRLAERLMALRA
jgi:hydroxymethylbilane synthase